jgi:hypothetical protein
LTAGFHNIHCHGIAAEELSFFIYKWSFFLEGRQSLEDAAEKDDLLIK